MSDEKVVVKLTEHQRAIKVWLTTRRKKGEDMPELPLSQATAIYEFLKSRVDEKLWTSRVTNQWIRLSIEYIRSMLFGEFGVSMEDLLVRTKAQLGEYLTWSESAFGKAVDKLGKDIVDKYVLAGYAKVAKNVMDKAEGGNLRAADLMFKTQGKATGSSGGPMQPIIEWTKSYGMFENGRQEVTMKISIPEQPNLLEGQDGKTI